MKGQQSLYSQFFDSNAYPTTQEQRPRNFFMPQRNELLVHRYYFYVKIKGYRYEKCLEELEKDLFITGIRQATVLSQCADLLSQVMNIAPSIRELQKKFPRLNWNL